MSMHKYEVGDVLQMCHGELDKVWVVYLSQSTGNKIRARVLGSDDENRIGQVHWYDPMHLDIAEKIGYNKYVPYRDYTKGDKLILIGKCCENEYWEGKPLEFIKFKNYEGHNYNHKINLRDHKGGVLTACVHCVRTAQPQLNLL